MTQTSDGAFKLIENMAASSDNMNQESNRSKKVNFINSKKIYEPTAKIDQLLKNNQGQIFRMEESTAGQIQNTQDVAPEA